LTARCKTDDGVTDPGIEPSVRPIARELESHESRSRDARAYGDNPAVGLNDDVRCSRVKAEAQAGHDLTAL
jgi:hypothetical protein